MQLSTPAALDLADEPKHILDMYGIDAPNVTTDAPMNEGEETRYFGDAVRRKLGRNN